MPKNIWRFIGSQDTGEGEEPFGVVDLDARSIQINTKLPIRPLAAAYTFNIEDTGNVFIASAALTFTLPTAAVGYKGSHLWLINGADTALTLSANTAGDLVVLNDVAANSVAWSTASEKIGAGWHIICDGSKWYALPMADETQTQTITT